MASILKLKRSFELHTPAKGKSEVRDSALSGQVVYRGTYRQCVAYAKKIGVWYSVATPGA